METFFSHDEAYVVLILAVIGLCLSTTFITAFWFKHLRSEKELDLKRELAERGMSAEEICAVINAGTHRRSDRKDKRHDKSFRTDFLRHHSCDHRNES
jgi:hypothetical protein